MRRKADGTGRDDQQQEPADIPRPPLAASVRSCRLRLLVIDDDPTMLRALERMLTHHDVTTVCGGTEALTTLEQGRFDAILCDINMPQVSGVGIYEYVARLFPGEQGRIVFMTGGAISEGARAYVLGTANPCLYKPFSVSELERALASAAASASGPPERRLGGSLTAP